MGGGRIDEFALQADGALDRVSEDIVDGLSWHGSFVTVETSDGPLLLYHQPPYAGSVHGSDLAYDIGGTLDRIAGPTQHLASVSLPDVAVAQIGGEAYLISAREPRNGPPALVSSRVADDGSLTVTDTVDLGGAIGSEIAVAELRDRALIFRGGNTYETLRADGAFGPTVTFDAPATSYEQIEVLEFGGLDHLFTASAGAGALGGLIVRRNGAIGTFDTGVDVSGIVDMGSGTVWGQSFLVTLSVGAPGEDERLTLYEVSGTGTLTELATTTHEVDLSAYTEGGLVLAYAGGGLHVVFSSIMDPSEDPVWPFGGDEEVLFYRIDGLTLDGAPTEGDDDLDGTAGTAGGDVIDALAGADTVAGLDGADRISGRLGADVLGGGRGDDAIFGGRGADTLHGQGGDDTLHGQEGADAIEGDRGGDMLWGGGGHDVLSGEGGDDTLVGGDGHDHLSDARGDDRLWGGAGADTLCGGAGADTLTGGAGADVFRFLPQGARDTVTDFQPGRDTLDFSTFGIDDPGADPRVAVRGIGARDTLVKVGDSSVVLLGVQPEEVDLDAMVFGPDPFYSL
ncbi:calcium-binding protein [Acuticoccus sp. I52.16.1]|uniref:calcium-binding protein n=1 Tax=Acuticoccus sp. I52.16.1 TaxID=2928472 RepID=UPI001FD3ACCB|nr:calcium-binding protein [Acuticoccus sp. I52.16.1]UOM35441.1 hypothetical protein MRB58_04325 [Acuticoccus sp. I52.16.1]